MDPIYGYKLYWNTDIWFQGNHFLLSRCGKSYFKINNPEISLDTNIWNCLDTNIWNCPKVNVVYPKHETIINYSIEAAIPEDVRKSVISDDLNVRERSAIYPKHEESMQYTKLIAKLKDDAGKFVILYGPNIRKWFLKNKSLLSGYGKDYIKYSKSQINLDSTVPKLSAIYRNHKASINYTELATKFKDGARTFVISYGPNFRKWFSKTLLSRFGKDCIKFSKSEIKLSSTIWVFPKLNAIYPKLEAIKNCSGQVAKFKDSARAFIISYGSNLRNRITSKPWSYSLILIPTVFLGGILYTWIPTEKPKLRSQNAKELMSSSSWYSYDSLKGAGRYATSFFGSGNSTNKTGSASHNNDSWLSWISSSGWNYFETFRGFGRSVASFCGFNIPENVWSYFDMASLASSIWKTISSSQWENKSTKDTNLFSEKTSNTKSLSISSDLTEIRELAADIKSHKNKTWFNDGSSNEANVSVGLTSWFVRTKIALGLKKESTENRVSRDSNVKSKVSVEVEAFNHKRIFGYEVTSQNSRNKLSEPDRSNYQSIKNYWKNAKSSASWSSGNEEFCNREAQDRLDKWEENFEVLSDF